ncbi:NADPH:quinone reductase [Micromonospora sp. NBC_01739]|uniref:NADPH:quinone reductase n=1 Tax=Micromonospora sp. NBC_01739 TaxID=2975985 RepID=UPI002E136AD2|nr:NADPH:quinone reductase [Micromonospora sp. NBC_01739]
MLAAYIERFGPPEEIRYGRLPDPSPGPTDVLVEVWASTVNPVDTFVRSGLFRTPVAFPFVIARDLVGRVVRAGPGAAGFAPGDPVWCNSLGHDGRQGAAAELAVVPADRLYRLPPGVDPLTAVGVLHPTATAYLGLFRHGQLSAGDTVLVGGAAGNVGSAAVVLAAQAGARVIATAGPGDLARCRSMGAAEAIPYDAPDLAARLRAAAPEGIDVHLDTSGHNDLRLAVDLLAHGGRIVLLAGARTEPVLPAGRLYMRDGSIRGFVISHASTAELAAAARTINRLLPSGLLRTREVAVLPLQSAAEAHAIIENGTDKRILLGL